MDFTIRLIKDWKNGDTEFAKGQILKMDKATGQILIDKGVAEEYVAKKNVSLVAEGEEPKLTEKHIDLMLAAVREVVKEETAANRKTPSITEVKDNVLDDGKYGFKSFGEQASSVFKANTGNGVDERLARVAKAAATTYGSEGSGADGGYLVAPDFSSRLMTVAESELSLLSRTDNIPVSSNSITVPRDQYPSWDNSNGVTVNWTGEGATMTQSKPKLGEDTLVLHKITALVPVTDELLQDAGALEAYLSNRVGAKMQFEIDYQLVHGNGVGKPLGFLNSGAKLAHSSGGTWALEDLFVQYSKMVPTSLGKAIWLCHPDFYAELTLATKDSVLSFINNANMQNGPPTAILGQPLFVSQLCNDKTTTATDYLMFIDPSAILTASRGMAQAQSMHFWFDTGHQGFRFQTRIAGQPWIDTTIADKNGTGVRSYFVTNTTA